MGSQKPVSYRIEIIQAEAPTITARVRSFARKGTVPTTPSFALQLLVDGWRNLAHAVHFSTLPVTPEEASMLHHHATFSPTLQHLALLAWGYDEPVSEAEYQLALRCSSECGYKSVRWSFKDKTYRGGRIYWLDEHEQRAQETPYWLMGMPQRTAFHSASQHLIASVESARRHRETLKSKELVIQIAEPGFADFLRPGMSWRLFAHDTHLCPGCRALASAAVLRRVSTYETIDEGPYHELGRHVRVFTYRCQLCGQQWDEDTSWKELEVLYP